MIDDPFVVAALPPILNLPTNEDIWATLVFKMCVVGAIIGGVLGILVTVVVCSKCCLTVKKKKLEKQQTSSNMIYYKTV
ncbi:protein ORF111 [Lake sturgeon herpesvirus]|nr:protein ORF111 [Lake sturgeon herpesvirus]